MKNKLQKMWGLTVNHVLSLHRLFRKLFKVLLINCQAPGLCFQVLGVGLQLNPQGGELGV